MDMRKIYFALLCSLVSLSSCTEKLLMEQEKDELQNRIDAATQIDVKYAVAGEGISELNFDYKARQIELEVELNDKGLVWDIKSDKDWCKVVPESHKGPGIIKLDISVNEDFDNRDAATLTFAAGAFRGFKLTVNQEGTPFLLSQPYFVSGRQQSDKTFNTSVRKVGGVEPEWSVSKPEWLEVTKGAIVYEDDETVTREVKVRVFENTEATRLGRIVLSLPDEERGTDISLTQFGSDYNYDAAGNIFFAKDQEAVLTFPVPSGVIADVKLPSYITSEIRPLEEGIEEITLRADENFSDCSELRLSEVVLTLSNLTETSVALPTISQDYVPAHGLVTSAGMLKFAQTVSEGGDISDWTDDHGRVVLVGDIDMSEVSGWKGIGTQEHPFSGEFDGKGHVIDNLKKSDCGLFNVCEKATISNVKLGAGCNIYFSNSFDTEQFLGGIVSTCKGTVLNSCIFEGNLELGGSCKNDCPVYVGGLVGFADDESELIACKFPGKLVLSAKESSGEMSANVGGIAGYNEGLIRSCEFSGSISLSTDAISTTAGGILPSVTDGMKVADNSCLGKIAVDCSSEQIAVGGLYGKVAGSFAMDFASDKSIAMGSIDINKMGGATDAFVMAGGLIGMLESGSIVDLKGYEVSTSFLIDHTVSQTAGYVCTGGAIGGSNPNDIASGKVTLTEMTNKGSAKLKCNTGTTTAVVKECLGGLMGYLKGPGSFIGCVNSAVLGDATSNHTTGKSNSKCQIVAGIIALAEMGNLEVKDCINNGNIASAHYNNNAYTAFNFNIQSGIVGAFSYSSTHNSTYTLTVSGCKALPAYIQGYRGATAGIVGYAENATISDCEVTANFSGSTMAGTCKSGNNSSYKGCVAGVLYNSSISNCTVMSDIYTTSAGSEYASPGGILSIELGKCTISGCSYFGTMTIAKLDKGHFGGLVGEAKGEDEDTLSVSGCKFGGTLNGTVVNENNVMGLAVGTANGTLSGISYWDGK